MNLEAFEKLVSDWLDDPEDSALRARLAAAVRGSPELGVLLERWRRVDQLLRGEPASIKVVDWDGLRRRIATACAESRETDRRLDELLQDVSVVTGQVDWARFRERVAATARAAGARSVPRRWRHRWLVVPVAGLAAAALVFAVSIRHIQRPATSGVWMQVVGPPIMELAAGHVEVRLAALEPVDGREECFLMIDPRRPTPAAAADSAGLF